MHASGIHRYPPMERVIYGMPLAEALAQEIERIGANAVYVLASGTLARADRCDRPASAACWATSWPVSARRSARTRRASTWSPRPTRRARRGPTRC